MAEFSKFSKPEGEEGKLASTSSTGKVFIDYKNVDELRRLLTPNGKIQSRKRTGLTSREQRTL